MLDARCSSLVESLPVHCRRFTHTMHIHNDLWCHLTLHPGGIGLLVWEPYWSQFTHTASAIGDDDGSLLLQRWRASYPLCHARTSISRASYPTWTALFCSETFQLFMYGMQDPTIEHNNPRRSRYDDTGEVDGCQHQYSWWSVSTERLHACHPPLFGNDGYLF